MISLCPQADQIAEAVCCEERTFFRRIIYLRAVRVKQGITVTKQCSAHFLPFAKFLVKLVIRQCSQILIIISGARKGPAFLFQSRCNLLYRLAVRLIIICGLVHLITKNAADTCHRDHAACALVWKIRMLVKKCFQHRNHIVSANEIVSAIIRIFCRRFSVFIKHKRCRHAISIAHRVVA